MHNLDCFAAFLNKKKKKKSPNFPFIDYVCKKKKFSRFYQSPDMLNQRLIFYQNKFYIVFIFKKN